MITNEYGETVSITKKVKVIWVIKNPFVRYLGMERSSEAYVPADMDFEMIEEFAREATPEGFRLKSIDVIGEVTQYDYNGDRL